MTPMFGFMVLHVLDEAQRQHLAELLESFNVALPPSGGTLPLPEALPPLAATGLLNGNVRRGDVTIAWEAGVPMWAQQISQPSRVAVVPQEFWNALRAEVPQSLWEVFTYLAFLESDYVATAKNPSDAEESWGVLQVNRRAWPQYSVDELTTFAGNLRAAVAIYNIQGVGAWFNSARTLGLL